MQIRVLVVLSLLALLLSLPLLAQERGRGGRPTAPSDSKLVRAPEGTRERPVSVPPAAVTTPHPLPPATRPSPSYDPYPSPIYVPTVEVIPTCYVGRATEPPLPVVLFSGGREGFGVVLGDYEVLPGYSGFDFSDEKCLPFDDPAADIFFEDAGGTSYMVVGEDGEIQDLGQTASLGEINALRMVEWSRSHDVVLEERRSYVVKTWEGRYAMFRVVSLVPDRVVFDWVLGRREDVITKVADVPRPTTRLATRVKFSQ